MRRYGPGSSFNYATTEPAVETRRKLFRDSLGRWLPSRTPRRRAAGVAVTEESGYVGRHRAEGEVTR